MNGNPRKRMPTGEPQTVEEARIFEFFYAYGAQPGPWGECAEDGCENDAWVSVRGAPRRYICILHYQARLEEAVRADARRELEAENERLRTALRGMLDEVEKTRRWRASTGMRPATDTSDFAAVAPSGLQAVERAIREALAVPSSSPSGPEEGTG